MSQPRLKVSIVNGSDRPGNYTAMASAMVAFCPRVQLEQLLREGAA